MIGRVPAAKHLLIATGFSGTGLTFGTAAGRIVADLILDRHSPYAGFFSPARLKPLAAASDFVSENLNIAKRFIADRYAVSQASSLDQVSPGEGRVLRLNGETLAVYRDHHNRVHRLSPVCTHAGCYVRWNGLRQTWDCPCHGGRYSATGQRIYGPPAADLKRKGQPVKLDQNPHHAAEG